MSALPTYRNLSAFNGSGTESVPAAATGLVTLTATDDYYFPIPTVAGAEIIHIHVQTDANFAGTFTIETCSFPAVANAVNIATISDWNETAGNWNKEDPTTGYIGQSGSGWTMTNLSAAKTAAAGGCSFNLGNVGARRVRLKAACTTTGAVRVMTNSKGAV